MGMERKGTQAARAHTNVGCSALDAGGSVDGSQHLNGHSGVQ